MCRTFIGSIFFLSFSFSLVAQTDLADTSFYSAYKEVVSVFPDIHNGGLYTEPHIAVLGHPFYASTDFVGGELVISGFEFKEVPLQYDIWDDVLITITPIHKQRITLNPQKIDQFILSDGTKFIRKSNAPLYYYHKNGFYREILEDEISLYCKHWKIIKKRESVFKALNSYLEKELFFIEINGALKSISKRRDAFRVLELSQKEVRPYVNREKIRYKKQPERYLEIMVEIANEKNHE